MFRAIKCHHLDISCRRQALLYNFISKYIWYFGDLSMYIFYRMEYIHICILYVS